MALPMQRATPAQAQATHAKAHAAVVRHARFMRHVRRQLCGAFTTRTSSIAGGSGAAGTRGQNPAIIVQLLPAFQKLDAMISDDSFEVDVHHFKNMMREAGVTTLGDKELENLFIECAIATETDAEGELGDLCDLSHDRSSAASPFAPGTAKMGGIATSALSSQASRDVALNERMSDASSATLAPHSVGYVASPLYQRLLRTTADHGQLLLHLGLGTEHGHGAPGTNAASRGFHAAASGSTFSFSPEIEENRQAFFARARLDMAETLVVIRRMFGSHGKQVHDVIRRLRAGAPDPRKAPDEDHQNPWTRLEVFEYLVSLGLTHSEAFLLLEHSTFLSFSSSGDRGGGIEPGAPGPHVTRRDPNAIAGVARLVSASAVRLDGPASATAAAANGAFDVAYLRAFLVERPMPEHVAMALLATKFAEAVADSQKEFSGTVGLKRFLALAVGGPGAARSISPNHPTSRSDVALHHAPAVSTGAGEAHRRSSLFLHDGSARHHDEGSRSVSPQPQPGAVRSASGKIGGAASGAGASDGTVGVAEKPTRVSPGRDSYYPSRSRSQSSAASVTATAQMDVFTFRQFMVAFGSGLPQGEVDLLFGFLVKRRAELDNAPPFSTQEAMSMPILAADVVSLFHDFFPHATEREKFLIVADAKAAIVDGPTSGAAVAAQTSHRGSGGAGGGAAAAHAAAAFPALMTLYLALFDDSRVVVPSTADGSPLPPRRVVYLKEFTAALRAHGVTAVHLCDVDIEHLWNITQEPREIVNLLGGPLPVSRHDLLVKLWRRLEQASAADGHPNFGQPTRTGGAAPFQRVPRKNVLDAFVPEAAERRVVQRGEELTHALRNFLETVENDALHFPATAYDVGDNFNGRGHVDPFAENPFSSTPPSTIGDDGAMSFRDFEFFWGAVGASFPDEALFVMTVWQSFGMHRDGRNLVDVQRALRRRSSANASSTAFGDAAPQPTAQSSAASRARLRASEREQQELEGERGGRGGGGGGETSSDPAPRSARLPPTAGYTPSHDKSVDSAARRMSGRSRVPDSVAHVHHTSSNVFGGTSPGVRRSDLSGTAAERRKTHDRLAEETSDVGVGRSTPPKFRRARSPQPNTYGSTAAAESCVPLGNDYSFSRPHSRPGGASPSRTPPRSPRSAPRGFEDGEFGPPQPSAPLHTRPAAGVSTNANIGAAAVGGAPSSPSRHGRGVGAGTGASAAAALGGGNVSTYYPGGVSGVGGGPLPHRRGSVRGESPAVASLDESFGSVTVSPRKNVTGRHHSLQSASLEAPLTPGRRKMSAPPTVVGSERPSGRARLGH